MGLGNRTARSHETVAAQHVAGVGADAYLAFEQGQSVMTIDGFPGVVAAVNDGPLPGVESYFVMLDNGLGEGEYSASQLSPLSNTTASGVHTAADDYPELGTILVDRPDIAPNTRMGSLRAVASDEAWEHDDYTRCRVCGQRTDWADGRHDESDHSEEEREAAGIDKEASGGLHDHSRPKGEHGIESFDELEPNDGAESGVDEHGHLTWDGSSPGCRDSDEYSMFGQNDAVKQAAHDPSTDPLDTSQCVSYKTDPSFCLWHKTDHLDRHTGEPRSDLDGHMNPPSLGDVPRCDLCNGLHDSLHHYDETENVGKDIFGNDVRGREGAKQASADAQCGCGNPGHTHDEHADWAEANNRDAWGRPLMKPYDGHGAWDCNNHQCNEHPQHMYDQQPGKMPGWLEHDAHPDAEVRREVNQSVGRPIDTEDANWLLRQQQQGPTKYSSFMETFLRVFNEQVARRKASAPTASGPWGIVTEAAGDADFRFEVTAAWSDVRRKAKRIRTEGGVHVTLVTEGMLFAEVKGDHNVYETGIQRLPGRLAIQTWSCGCKWGAYHWGASDDFSRFAGRMCSHALALQYEAQSRGMFGKDVTIDDSKPAWAPRSVVVKYDIDADRNLSGPATPVHASLTAAAALVTHARTQEVAEDVRLAFAAAGIPWEAALAAEAAVNDAWGEPTGAAPTYQPGPTKPKDPTENPASAGWASAPEPESWGQAGPSGLNHMISSLQDDAIFEPEMGKEALAPLVPLLLRAAPQVLKAVAPAAKEVAKPVIRHEVMKGLEKGLDRVVERNVENAPDQHPITPVQPVDDDENNPLNYGARAELHDEPEGALPSTDGDAWDPQDPDGLEPESSSFVSTGSVNDIVREFQSKAAHLQGGGSTQGSGDIAAAAKEFLAKTALKDFTPAEQAQIINEGEHVRAANLDRLDIAGTHYEPLEAALAAADDEEGWMS